MIEDYVAVDLEMTGFRAKRDAILEVGAVRVRGKREVAHYSALLDSGRSVPEDVAALTGITDEMLRGGMDPEEAMEGLFAFMGDDVIAGQNVVFDYRFLKQWAMDHSVPFERSAVDTLYLARKFLPPDQKKDLGSLCAYFGVGRGAAHRALDDARAAHLVLERLREGYGEMDPGAFSPRPLRYEAKKRQPATERQKERLRRLGESLGVDEFDGIRLSSPPPSITRNEASRIADRLAAMRGGGGEKG